MVFHRHSKGCTRQLGGGEEVGVAPDAPLAVGAAAEDGEDVAGVFAGFAAFDGGEGDFEEVPADGQVALDGDLLDVRAAVDGCDVDHGAEVFGELFAAHGCAAGSEEDDVISHEIVLRGEVSGGGGFAPAIDEGADLLLVLFVSFVGGIGHFWATLVSFSRAVRTMSLVRSSGRTSGAEFTGAG